MKKAATLVLDRNPVLMGRAKLGLSGLSEVIISIAPGVYSSSHHFDNKMNLDEMNDMEILSYMDTFLAPIVPKSESVLSLI